MEKKLVVLSFALIVFLILGCVTVSAITGKIGNAKMILTVEVGDTIDRTIKVINDNNVAVAISLTASGDLVDDINIIDNEFTLEPGEDKNARFTIEVKEAGTFDNRINVQFTPEQGNGVGLSAQVIVKAIGEEQEYCGDNTCNNQETCSSCSEDCGKCDNDNKKSNNDKNDDNNNEPDNGEEETNNEAISSNGITGNVIGENKGQENDNSGVSKPAMSLLALSTVLLAVILIGLNHFSKLNQNKLKKAKAKK